VNTRTQTPASVRLGDLATFNPATPKLPADEQAAFVPMASVSELGTMRVSQHVSVADLKSGYSYMQTGDVLVAKITPCFENKKIAVAKLDRTHGFGSTEFHVIRPTSALDGRYLVHFLRQDCVNTSGERRMTGSAGQRRVPRQFFEELSIPLPALGQQQQIAAILDQADDLRRKRRHAVQELYSLPSALLAETFGELKKARLLTICRLDELVRQGDRINYGVVQPGSEVSEGVPVIRVENVVDDDFSISKLKHISGLIEAQYSRSRLKGDGSRRRA
jgi:type I restriction enzyme, S subunit